MTSTSEAGVKQIFNEALVSITGRIEILVQICFVLYFILDLHFMHDFSNSETLTSKGWNILKLLAN